MKKSSAVIAFCSLTLAANLALGDGHPIEGRLDETGRFSLVTTGHGPVDLAGIKLLSSGGYLGPGSADGLDFNIDGVRDIKVVGKAPFFPATNVLGEQNAGTDVAVVENTSHRVTYGVVGAGKLIRIDDIVETSIQYDPAFLGRCLTDLHLRLWIFDSVSAEFPGCPESSSALLAVFGFLGVLGFRRRHR